jgi:serine/threonine protein phosphatase PrpC
LLGLPGAGAAMKIRYAGSTHVGMKRAHNEDNFFLLAEENLYVVADGMGGHASGEVASQMAVETLAEFYINTARDREITWPYKEDRACTFDQNRLVTGIKLANRQVFEAAQRDARYRGMGTTLVSLVCGPTGAYIGHVGDSRGYLVRDNAIVQITEDHSLLNDYLKIHRLSPEEIANFPHKNVILRALGMKPVVAVETLRLQPQPGDLYLLCSDGLSGMVDDATILQNVQQGVGDLERICQGLIARANAEGGQDNITVVLIEFSA